MGTPLRALAIYGFLLLIFRIAGKRTLAQVTTFDFVLLLIIGEATQQALIGNDFSITTGLLLIVSLLGIDIGFSYVLGRLKPIERMLEGAPVIVVDNGTILEKRLKKARVAEDDLMEAARRIHGLERLDQIKYAVLERDGAISIVPRAEAEWRARTEGGSPELSRSQSE